MISATFNSLYNPNNSLHNPNNPSFLSLQSLARLAKILILLGVLICLFFGFAESAFAEEDCESGSCALACNHASRICSFFSPKKIAGGYTRVSYLPAGYKRTSSQCSLSKCPPGSTTCERWGRAKIKS